MADAAATRNARLLVAYDGTPFRGFAENPDVRTVMGDLRTAIERVVRTPAELVGAGRTDAGVHAWGQVVSGRLPSSTDLERLQRSVNRLCAPAIVVRRIEWVGDDFSARFSATARTYRYDVWNAPVPNPLLEGRGWHVPTERDGPLDVAAMNRAARTLVGEHDFASFCRKASPLADGTSPSTVRRVLDARWAAVVREGDGALLRFEIGATSFCHQMVRSIVGTLVDVGRRRRDEDLTSVIAAGDRSAAGAVAPPEGLVLWDVDYRGTRWDT